MERTKTVEEDLPRWRKVGGGTFRLAGGRIIKKNQIFHASVSQIPDGFRDVVIPVDKFVPPEPLALQETKYTVTAGSPGWYNVVDPNGKVMNEKQMRQAEAQSMVEALMA